MRSYLKVLLMPGFVLLLAGCLALGPGLNEALPVAGLDQYQVRVAQIQSEHGCDINYRLYEPEKAVTSDLVILGHGFLRSQDNMIELGRALANAGIRTATLDFCNMRPWNGHHERNADDMRLLAEREGTGGKIIFAGFSAGGLAALLAANSHTRAVVTLDLVDQADLGLNSSNNLTIPVLGLHGPASSCNANNNSQPVFEQHTDMRQAVLVPDASHCEFEAPTNWLCEMACGDDQNTTENNLTRASIIEQTVAMILAQLPSDESQPVPSAQITHE